MEKKLHPYLKQRLEEEENFRVKGKEAKGKKLTDAIREGKALREVIFKEVYPEWQFLIREGKHPTYFRIDVSERKADAYSDRSESPLLVVLPPNKLMAEDNFFDYFGITSDVFLRKVEHGLIIPQILWPTDYAECIEKSEFCKKFFDNWLENEELHKKPLLFANRIQELLGGEPSAKKWKERYGDKFKSVEGKEIEVPGLKKSEASEYLAERYGFLSLTWEDGARILEELLKLYEKGKLPLQFVGNFTFTGHQFRASHILYSKGGVVTTSIGDVRRSLKNIRKVANIFGSDFSPEFLYLWSWIYWIKEQVEKLQALVIPIARVKPSDRKKYYEETRKDDERRESLKKITETENKIIDMTINKQGFENPDEIEVLMDDLQQEMEKLRLATGRYERIVTEFAPTAITLGAELLLPYLPPEVTRPVSSPIEDILRGVARDMTKLTFKDFVVPVSVWQQGKSKWEGPLRIV